jgi:hypothetical protein
VINGCLPSLIPKSVYEIARYGIPHKRQKYGETSGSAAQQGGNFTGFWGDVNPLKALICGNLPLKPGIKHFKPVFALYRNAAWRAGNGRHP